MNGSLDQSRVFRLRATLFVYIPPKPPPQPDDMLRDFPPGLPPEVHYNDVVENYWHVLRTGKMPYHDGEHHFSEADMEWLRAIEIDVESTMRKLT